ncbi:hypothetical protein GP482_04850 [Streptococcus ruminicola]|uniref:Uncharacterized protein n=1 Tax=Streptococcus ruminicola TaxID=2686210 RepID=A0AAE6R5M3_9STRE|nr:hypothetical protein [Streptococcus ruminicola]QGX00879.1 hypothetical protein GO995_06300 [Streptococcus ruminicola]QGZ27504.1 hypothetical protein GP482_04850 [Streptococcus ruminicola]WFM82298.1 hypothetical protein P7Y79_03100 [Streptococcus ruminicola]
MFELRRYFNYKARYLFDSICEVIYSLIFITGIIIIFDSDKPINLINFFIYYSMTNIILLANEELEYEIRTDQYANISTTKRTPMMIYITRSLTYFIWSTFIFSISILLSYPFFYKKFTIPSLDMVGLMVITALNCISFLVIYALTIKLTERFKRISVLLNLFNTIMLFYSGLVFPTSFASYADLLDIFLN